MVKNRARVGERFFGLDDKNFIFRPNFKFVGQKIREKNFWPKKFKFRRKKLKFCPKTLKVWPKNKILIFFVESCGPVLGPITQRF